MATKQTKRRMPAAAEDAVKLQPIEAVLAGEPARTGETRLTIRMRVDEYDPLRKLAKRYKHSPQSLFELALNEFLVKRGIQPFKGVSGKIDRPEDPLRDWDNKSAK